MFSAEELQASEVNISFHVEGFFGQSSCSIRDCKIALDAKYVFFWYANAAHQRQHGLFHGQRVLVVAYSGQTVRKLCHRHASNLVPLRPPDVRLPARPAERAINDTVVALFAQATCIPPLPPVIKRLVPQIVLLDLRDQNLGLLRQARNMREARRPAASTHAHETLLGFPMESLRADVARLALCVLGARLDRDRDGLLVFFVGVILLRVAAAVYFLTAQQTRRGGGAFFVGLNRRLSRGRVSLLSFFFSLSTTFLGLLAKLLTSME